MKDIPRIYYPFYIFSNPYHGSFTNPNSISISSTSLHTTILDDIGNLYLYREWVIQCAVVDGIKYLNINVAIVPTISRFLGYKKASHVHAAVEKGEVKYANLLSLYSFIANITKAKNILKHNMTISDIKLKSKYGVKDKIYLPITLGKYYPGRMRHKHTFSIYGKTEVLGLLSENGNAYLWRYGEIICGIIDNIKYVQSGITIIPSISNFLGYMNSTALRTAINNEDVYFTKFTSLVDDRTRYTKAKDKVNRVYDLYNQKVIKK